MEFYIQHLNCIYATNLKFSGVPNNNLNSSESEQLKLAELRYGFKNMFGV